MVGVPPLVRKDGGMKPLDPSAPVLDPELVKGVFFASRPFRAVKPPGIADVTASVRALIGAPAPADAAGRSLW